MALGGDLKGEINRFRWIEYSFSATVMILLIAFYAGITQVVAAIAIIGSNVAMILFGSLQERMNPPSGASTTMLPFWFGCFVGAAPWFAITFNIVGSETVPGFVYGIFISLSCSSCPSRSTSTCSTARSGRGASTRSGRRPTWC